MRLNLQSSHIDPDSGANAVAVLVLGLALQVKVAAVGDVPRLWLAAMNMGQTNSNRAESISVLDTVISYFSFELFPATHRFSMSEQLGHQTSQG